MSSTNGATTAQATRDRGNKLSSKHLDKLRAAVNQSLELFLLIAFWVSGFSWIASLGVREIRHLVIVLTNDASI